MKIIFKIFLISCLFICISTQTNAQNARKRLTSDIHIGLNFAEMDIKGANMYKEPKLGMHIGWNINYKIYQNIQIQTGFYVTKRGLKQHIQETSVNEGAEVVYYGDTLKHTTANYMQIPLSLGYELYLTKKFAFNVNAGMYIAYGYKGTHKEEGFLETRRGNNEIIVETIPSIERDTFGLRKWNRWDYGAILSFGLIYDIYTINFNYEYGFYNISDEGRNLKNRNPSISLGFRF